MRDPFDNTRPFVRTGILKGTSTMARKRIAYVDEHRPRKLTDPALTVEDCDDQLAVLRVQLQRARQMDPVSVGAIERLIDEWLDARITLSACADFDARLGDTGELPVLEHKEVA